MRVRTMIGWGALAATMLAPAAAGAQIRTVDPNTASQSAPVAGDTAPQPAFDEPPPAPASVAGEPDTQPYTPPPSAAPAARAPLPEDRETARQRASADARGDTYEQQDLLDAAENTFGKGASGLAKMIESVLRKQGRPNAYISGREVSGALGIGLRYGSGTLYSKIEGDHPVYWTGPSLGFDIGGNGAKEFVLVYNLYDTADLYHRFPAAQGTLYVIGGFTASYLRKGDVVLIPIQLGVGWRAGVNVGYMHFTRKTHILPF